MYKCKFNQPSSFLGHTISKDALHPDKDRVSAVAHAPAPHDTCSLRSFLGLASWYSKFIPNFATVVEPLHAALKDFTHLKFTRTAEDESSFAEIERLILESPALALYDPALPTQLTTDATDYGLGAVLTQVHPDNMKRTVPFIPECFPLLKRSTQLLKHFHVFWQ